MHLKNSLGNLLDSWEFDTGELGVVKHAPHIPFNAALCKRGGSQVPLCLNATRQPCSLIVFSVNNLKTHV